MGHNPQKIKEKILKDIKQNITETKINPTNTFVGVDALVSKPFYSYDGIEIYKGDNRDIIPILPPVNLIVTDPPYQAHFGNGGGAFGNRKYFADVKDGVGSDLSFEIAEYLEPLRSICKPFNAYFWTSQKLIKDYIGFAVANKYSYDILVWNKTNPIPTKNNKYLPDLEYCVYMREGGAVFNNNLKFDMYKKLFITQVNKSEYGHPTEKPIDVIYPSILISSNEGDTILDPFVGSGTTLEVAKTLGRKGIGIEISQKYCDIAQKRLSQTIMPFSY